LAGTLELLLRFFQLAAAQIEATPQIGVKRPVVHLAAGVEPAPLCTFHVGLDGSGDREGDFPLQIR
jgi:hypothetical protein